MARQKPQLKLATMRLEEQEIQKTEMMKKEIMEEEGEYENGGGGNENGGGGNENGGGGNENEGQEMTMEEGDEPGDDDNDQGNGEEENEEENKEDQEAENEEEDKEDQEDENEEEEKEKDKDLPATPPGEASRSEEEWKKRGLNANDIRTKRFRKQQRHRLCEKGKRSLEGFARWNYRHRTSRLHARCSGKSPRCSCTTGLLRGKEGSGKGETQEENPRENRKKAAFGGAR